MAIKKVIQKVFRRHRRRPARPEFHMGCKFCLGLSLFGGRSHGLTSVLLNLAMALSFILAFCHSAVAGPAVLPLLLLYECSFSTLLSLLLAWLMSLQKSDFSLVDMLEFNSVPCSILFRDCFRMCSLSLVICSEEPPCALASTETTSSVLSTRQELSSCQVKGKLEVACGGLHTLRELRD